MIAALRNLLSRPSAAADTTTLSIPHSAIARVKITRADGTVEHAEVPMDDLELYLLPNGDLSPTYPAETRPRQ